MRIVPPDSTNPMFRAYGAKGCGLGVRRETAKIEIRKTNLECPLESTKPKNEVERETVTTAFRSPGAGTKSFIHNSLTVRRRDFAARDCLYHIA